ncbi:MAG: ATP-binding protein, partial [Nitrospirae bacterium]|nr:ATP-binding protein [Nitrospirota bacterium]
MVSSFTEAIKEQRKKLSDYSARIKPIYLELHDYKFFHGPSEVDNLDGRFIGRKKLTERLTSLLTNDETKSGAYLVTGFKGMGKTSLVSKVIADVTTAGGGGSVLARYIRILLLLLFLPLVEVYCWTTAWNVTLIGISLVYLFMNDLKKYLSNPLLFFENIFTISKIETSRFKLRTAVHDFLIVLIIRLASIFTMEPLKECYCRVFSLSGLSGNIFNYTFELHVYLIFILTLITVNYMLPRTKKSKIKKHFIIAAKILIILIIPSLIMNSDILLSSYKYCQSYLKICSIMVIIIITIPLTVFWNVLHKLFNYNHRIYVKINLGHDNLKEIDILRLIAKNVITQFNEFSRFKLRFPLPDMPSLLFKIMILYTVLSVIYLIPPITHINNVIKIKSGLVRYFPSQAFFMLKEKNVIKRTLEKIDGNENMYRKYVELFYSNIYDNTILESYGLKKNVFYKTKHEEHRKNKNTTNITTTNQKTDSTTNNVTDERSEIQKITNAVDMSVNALFYKAMDILKMQPSLVIMNKIKQLILGNFIHTRYSFIPRHVDYLFIAYFVLLWFIGSLIFRYKPLGFRTYESVRKDIADLSDSLNATVTKEGLTEAMVGKYRASFFRVSGKQTKVYPRADAREIEKQLIDVLDEIDKILKLIKRPQFIFIFDELDKIEPQPGASEKETSTNEKDATEKAPTSTGSESLPFSTHEARQRQQSIFKILSNLKYFLTTAKAKFIFIAGREIYDASLADVSDRNYFMSSIFHDVLYVNSFLTDSPGDKSADITHMIEQYVCRYLIPGDYTAKGADADNDDDRYSVKIYRKYLQEKVYKISTDKKNDDPIKRLQIEKLVVTVNNFITYLTYRSNGSPKKLTRYFEQFVVQPGEEKLTAPENLCVPGNSNNLYLKFGFFDQYTIGLVSYIATPVMLAIEKTIRNFGDKILVSTAFIVDHIYKYHRHAFTWRNLEVTPEILDINKAPELRELMERIIQFMLKHNLHEILSGPYNFRFTKKMSDEISYLSKISEKESAAFNFTLDESIALKRHYKVYQKSLEKKYGTALNAKDTAVIKSVSFVHMILGELHFYDEEYHDAIIELMESIQQLSNINDVKDMDVSTFYSYIHTMMLLGLAYEKGKSFSSAFAMYEKTISVMIDYKNKNEKKEKQSIYSLMVEHKDKDKYFSKSFFENKRHLYQPLLAKLQLIEKRSLNGITDSDIQMIEEEHRKLRGNNFSEKFVVESEFFCRLGDILYYKNGFIPKNKPKSSDSSDPNQIPDSINKGLCSKFSDLANENAKKVKHPCRACEYYTKSLAILCKDKLGIDITDGQCKYKYKDKDNFNMGKILIDMLNTIPGDNSENETQKKVTELKVIGNLLSNIGDTLLSCITTTESTNSKILTEFIEGIGYDNITWNILSLEAFIELYYDKNTMYPVFALYCASALFFMAGRMHKEYSFQFTKILRLIRECLKVPYKQGQDRVITIDDNLIKTIREALNNRIFQGIYKSYENVHRLEIEKFKGFFDNSNDIHNYNNLSISGDIREIIIDYTEIKLKSESVSILEEEIMPNYAFISPYITIYTMRNRIVELNLRAITNVSLWVDFADMKPKDRKYSNYKLAGKPYEKFRRKMKYRQIIDIFPSNTSKKIETTFKQKNIDSLLVMEFLITDSIFCLSEIIKISKTYAFSYDMNHSYMASTHLKFAI